MRVVVVGAWPPWPPTDGARLILHHQLRLLASRHELTVLCADGTRGSITVTGPDHGLPDGLSVRTFGPSLPRRADYAARRLRSARSREPSHVSWVERRELLRALAAEEAHADIVHLHGWGTAQLSDRIHAAPTVHMAIDAWGLGFENRRLPAWRRMISRPELAKVHGHEARHYARCDRVLVVSPSDARYLKQVAPGARVVVVPNGVEPGPEPSPASQRFTIGFHGAFEAYANIDAARALVTDILPGLATTVPDVQVLLVGRGGTRAVGDLAGPRVTVTDEVPEVRPWLERMTVYVAPLTSGTGIKNKILEAMAAGRAVVGTPLALNGIGPSDGVFEAESWQDVVASVAGLLRDPEQAAAAGQANRRRVVRDFTWDKSVRRVEDVWNEVAQERARS